MNSQQTIGIKIAIDAASGRAEVVGLSGDLLKLEGAGQKVHSTFTRLGPAVGAALAGIGLAEIGRELLQTATRFDSLNKSAAAVAGSSAAAAAQLEFVRNTSRTLGLSLLDSAKAYNSLAASAKGTSLEGAGAQRIFTAVAKAASALGLSTDEANGALLAIGQMMSKGTVSAEELRGQLGERLPGAFQIAARAMGVSTAELGKMVEQGQVLSTDFLPKFAAELDKTYSSARFDGIQNNINRLTSSWDTFKLSVADVLPFNAAIQAATAMVDAANRAMGAEMALRASARGAPLGLTRPGGNVLIQPGTDVRAKLAEGAAGPLEVLSKTSADDAKAMAKSDLELAEAKAKAEHNVRALTDAYAGQLVAEGKLSASAARHIAEQNAQKDALGWTASASKALAATQSSLSEKINDVVAGYDMQIAALGMSAREAAAFEGVQKVQIGLNAKELEQLRQKPGEMDKIRERALKEYDLLQKKEEVMRRIADFDARQGIGAGLTMSADRAQRELDAMRRAQAGGYYGEGLQREMGIQRAMMDARQQYVDTGLNGAGLDSAMADAERSIRAAEGAQYQLNETLGKTNDLGHEIGMTFSSAFEDAVIKGEDLRGVLAGILEDIGRIAMRTAVTEPMGKFLGSAFSSAFSSIGGLFGGGSSAGGYASPTPSLGGGGGGMPLDAGSFGFESLGITFANGGVMTSSGSLPLHKYASGGIANTPQLAVFGEGRLPEAYVPLPDGRRIPVAMSGGGGGVVVQIIDQRQGGAAIEQQQSTGPGGEQIVRLIVRDEMARGTVPLVRSGMQNGLFKNEFALYNARRTGQ